MEAQTVRPVIVIGSHRSGTSLLIGLLAKLGLFIGSDHGTGVRESRMFRSLNGWILQQSGARWDNPTPIGFLLEHQKLPQVAAKILRCELKSPKLVGYLGWRGYFRYRHLGSIDRPWGWKDPRNTFTLPIWLRVYPAAKVIHICRHGVDVAASLQKREIAFLQQSRSQSWMRSMLGILVPHCRARISRSPRCLTLEGAFSLWECYMCEARKHIEAMPDQSIEIRYESLLLEPKTKLRSLSDFCGLKTSTEEIEGLSKQIRPGRAFAFQSHTELAAFSSAVEPRLARFGY